MAAILDSRDVENLPYSLCCWPRRADRFVRPVHRQRTFSFRDAKKINITLGFRV